MNGAAKRDSAGQAAVGAQASGIAGGPEGLRTVRTAVCARAGVMYHLQLQPAVGHSLSSLEHMGTKLCVWRSDVYVGQMTG